MLSDYVGPHMVMDLIYKLSPMTSNAFLNFSDDEPQLGCSPPVPPGGANHSPAHHPSLFCLQSHVGLDHPGPDVLHRRHGPLQRGLQKQDDGRRPPAGG